MPGFLGGSSGSSSSGVGGEISFPKEFIDPVTKLRVSTPENLIDTDFEYGLQPTKWETVELINNTPSFFSKSGDTTIPNITSITTNAGTREITVTTGLEHGLAVGIPINVTGTKSITADGAYIINSIPNSTTFTYLCKDTQPSTLSIEDLYSSIITGEFFQGSQIRIADAGGIETDGQSVSTLTVTTDSAHGFYTNTPFYFLNLNSTISQEFAASNTETKSFDASNSATAQTFDGSNTLSSINIDWSNSAVVGGVTSSISATNITTDQITVSHGTENFVGKTVGTPLYYNVSAGAGYFLQNPRGVIFLKELISSSASSSTFTVSEVPDGNVIDLTTSMTGTFQLANQARTFAGNNVNTLTEQTITIVNDTAKTFNGTNTGGAFGTVSSYSGSLITVASGSGAADLSWYAGRMVLYTTTGTAATGLTNNTTYFIDQFFSTGGINYAFTVKPLPTSAAVSSISGGSGTQRFTEIGISPDRDVIHIKDHGFSVNDMLKYTYPVGGRFTVGDAAQEKNFYFVSQVYDQHNFNLNYTLGELIPQTVSRTGTNAGTAITPTEMTAIGFGAGLAFAVTSGTLPAGLTLNTSTGVVSGTPSATTPTTTVVITATDSLGTTAFQTHTYQFNPAPNLYSFTSATFGQPQQRTGVDIGTARSYVGNPSWASTYLTMPWYQGYQVWTVPQTATYRIRVAGAGHNGNGFGAVLQGDVSLTQGQQLVITVGSRGLNAGSGYQDSYHGCGASSVSIYNSGSPTSSTPLIFSGGGGSDYSGGWNGYTNASLNSSGQPRGTGSYGWTNGEGGFGYHGGSGGGRNSNGFERPSGVGMGNRFGRGWVNGYEGGYDQGFGGFGGGGGYHTGRNGGGGGGGYTGGTGGNSDGYPGGGSGSGGASYFNTSLVSNRFSTNGEWSGTSNANESRVGEGYVTITRL